MLFILLLCSCSKSPKEHLSNLVSEWTGKAIIYPNDLAFTLWGQDTVETDFFRVPYKIVSYVDSVGCVSCKLQIFAWEAFISELNLRFQNNVSAFLFFHSGKSEEISFILKRDKFNNPVYIDKNDSFRKLNHFPSETEFQTFLLDKNNKVLAIGNPIHNPQIKKLYFDIILKNPIVSNKRESPRTEVYTKKASISLRKFDLQQRQETIFTLTNVGTNPLVIDDVTTSCSCVSADYSKEPVQPGDSISLHVTYKTDHPGYFDKIIKVYCNAESSPVILRIKGNAE